MSRPDRANRTGRMSRMHRMAPLHAAGPAQPMAHGAFARPAGLAPLHQVRHCLVVATQCPAAEQQLDGLADAARDLHRALTDPALGACQDSPSKDAERVRSGDADQPAVEAAIRDAIARAGRARAVLVLALLGHGQSPRGTSHLYYMASNSLPEDVSSSVDVNGMITAAADHPGVAGVIVLLDTCQSGAALTCADALVGGFRDGQTRASVLAATSAHEAAYDLDFTRRVVRLMNEGFDGAGEFVPMRCYRAALLGALDGQDAVALDYDGMPTAAEEGLWLSVNARRRPVTGAEGLGTVGMSDLAAALRAWPQYAADAADGGGAGPAAFRSHDGLAELRDRAGRSGDLGALRVYEVADALLLVRATELFLVRWAGRQLTSYTVHRAMAELNARAHDVPGPAAFHEPMRAGPGLSGSDLLRAFLEHAALRQTTMDGRRTTKQTLARCLVAVAEACELDAGDDEVRQWADAHGMTVDLNDARAWAGQQRERPGASLVVSLHAARIDWPEEVLVWLRRGGEPEHRSFACPPSQAGVEGALVQALGWAQARLPAGERVNHVDVVVPAALLPSWRPEEVAVGIYLLGVDRTVAMRWADRLTLPEHFGIINDIARERLVKWQQDVLTTGQAPVDWLGAPETGRRQELDRLMRAGRYKRALGLCHRPQDIADLVQALLPYSPVLLWPGEEGHVVDRPPAALARYWERLPEEFARAHQVRWSGECGDDPADRPAELAELAVLRAAWHDLAWLDFCRWFKGTEMTAAATSAGTSAGRGA